MHKPHKQRDSAIHRWLQGSNAGLHDFSKFPGPLNSMASILVVVPPVQSQLVSRPIKERACVWLDLRTEEIWAAVSGGEGEA